MKTKKKPNSNPVFLGDFLSVCIGIYDRRGGGEKEGEA